MNPMTRHLPSTITDAVDDLTAIHIALYGLPNSPDLAFRDSVRHLSLAMLGNVTARLTDSLEMVEHECQQPDHGPAD